jgi:hypothetical protein
VAVAIAAASTTTGTELALSCALDPEKGGQTPSLFVCGEPAQRLVALKETGGCDCFSDGARSDVTR